MNVIKNSGPKITPKVIEWLHQCWIITEGKRPLQPDPFYKRNEVLEPEIVKAVIDSMEDLFVSELAKYPGYHRNAQGISSSEYLVPPGFNKLPYIEQFAIVQGIDKIFQEFRDNEPVEEPKPEPKPVDY
jgi:hypothetical protein